ncbi:glycosyl transferase family 1 [Pseudoalteromonas sp. NBT06-2]|uniref:glycosyltransferase family 4 protein n=1 Tax=Pseudoalteromonas sp. NBT06-2 TaxID=2025950 RepID=UPI000BA5EEE7|nr:glycosyltransferase family 4 protein [Pseudoalteromonas sp. NBT06-2]PAJ74468.1 glycosyl transferase family 1 [Pseudoalteromonas sp. NBT06-2]
MKVLHICLSNFYIDNVTYQENMLIKEHIDSGHEVKVLASTEIFDSQKKLVYSKAGTYTGAEGAEVTRIDYAKFLPHIIMKKLRVHSGVYQFIENFKPDVIMFHSMCGWELKTVCKYKKNNPSVKLYMDSHEDFNNSARGFISKYFLHWLYYRPIAKKASTFSNKVLCISIETMGFLNEFYGIDKSRLEFYPLGGKIKGDNEYDDNRVNKRKELGLSSKDILFLQCGKLTKRKKLLESISAFVEVENKNFKLIIAGLMDFDVETSVRELIEKDERITFLGWQTSEQVEQLLDASDVYLQPGTQSATMQASLCARSAIIIDNVASHQPYLKENGWFANDSISIKKVLEEISKNPHQLVKMSQNSFDIAKNMLNYKKLATRILK